MFRIILAVFLLSWLPETLWAINYDSDTQLDFKWSEASGNPNHYNVYVCMDELVDNNGEKIYRFEGPTEKNSYTVMGEAGHSYRIKVEAVDAAGNVGPISEESDLVICQTKSSLTSHLSAGINMMAVPLKPNKDLVWKLSDLGKCIGPNLLSISCYDESIGRLVTYSPQFPLADPMDVLITAGKGYIVIMEAATDVIFEGTAWDDNVTLAKGINISSVPLCPGNEWRLNDLAEYIGSGVSYLMWYDKRISQYVSYFPPWSKDDPSNIVVKGDESYLVFMESEKEVTFTGQAWKNEDSVPSPFISSYSQPKETTPILIVEGLVKQERPDIALNMLQIKLSNRKRDQTVNSITGTVANDGRYVVTLMDFLHNNAAQVGDVLEITASDPTATYSVEPIQHIISASDIKSCLVSLDDICLRVLPKHAALLQSYPNPFNPETWIPYQLSSPSEVTILIYDIAGHLVRTLSPGNQPAGYYEKKQRAAYWNGRNEDGEKVKSGIYFYTLKAGTFQATKKFVLLK